MREMSEIGMRDLLDWPFFVIGLLALVPIIYFWCLAVYEIIESVAGALDSWINSVRAWKKKRKGIADRNLTQTIE